MPLENREELRKIFADPNTNVDTISEICIDVWLIYWKKIDSDIESWSKNSESAKNINQIILDFNIFIQKIEKELKKRGK